MAQGFDGVFDRTLVDDARAESDQRSFLWLIVPVLLAIGWGIFFGYTAVYLSDDPPQRSHRYVEGTESDGQIAPSALVMLPIPKAAQSDAPPRAEPVAVAQAEPSTTDGLPPVPGTVATKPDAIVQPLVSGPRLPDANRAEFVGVWGPTQAACHAPSRRKGYIPARITTSSATAGRTICNFRDSRRAGNTWIMAAECSDRGRRWSSQVRLTVDGDRLTWSSAKGASAYIRCGRRDG